MAKLRHQDVVTAIRTGKITADEVRSWLDTPSNHLVDESGKTVPFQEPKPLEVDHGLSLSDIGSGIADFGKGAYNATLGGLKALAGSALNPQLHLNQTDESGRPIGEPASVPFPETGVGAPIGLTNLLAPLFQIGQGQVASTKAQSAKAAEHVDTGTQILAQRGLHGLLPALGESAAAGIDLASSVLPVASQFGQAAERLDRPEQIPEALGEMTGMLAGPKVMSSAIRALPRLGEVPAGGTTGPIANAIEQTIPGKQVFGKLRAKQFASESTGVEAENAARTAAYETEKARVAKQREVLDQAHAQGVEDFGKAQGAAAAKMRTALEDLAPPNANLPPAELADQVSAHIRSTKANASRAFEDADLALNTGKTGIIPIRNLKATAANLLQETKESHAIPLSDRSDAIGWLQGIEQMPDQLTYRQAQNALSDLMTAERRMARTGALATRAGKERLAVSEALRRDLDSSLDKLTQQGLDPKVVENLQAAKGTWRDLHRPAVQDLVDRLKSDPESAHKILLDNGTLAEDIDAIKKVLPKPLYENMKTLAVKDLIEPFIKKDVDAAGNVHEVLAGKAGLNNVRLRAKLYKLLPQPLADKMMEGMKEAASLRAPERPDMPAMPSKPELLPKPEPYQSAVPSTFAAVYNALHNAAASALSIGAGGSLALGSLGKTLEAVGGSAAQAGSHAVSPLIIGGGAGLAASDAALWTMAKMLTRPRFANAFVSAAKSAAAGNRMAVAQAIGRMTAQAEPELQRTAEEGKAKAQAQPAPPPMHLGSLPAIQ